MKLGLVFAALIFSGLATGAEELKFKIVEMREGCAPNDASAIVFDFNNGAKSPFPTLGMTWWGEPRPSRNVGTYEIAGKDGKPVERYFYGSYCVAEKKCAALRSVKVKVQVRNFEGGELEFEGSVVDGTQIRIRTSFKLSKPQKRRICG